MTLEALLAALAQLPASARGLGWLRVVEHAMTATPAQLELLDRALARWPARSRPAWDGWYAEIERTEQTGPWEGGDEIFRGLIEPTSPAFVLARHVGMWFDMGVGAETLAELARWPWLRTITSVSLRAGYRDEIGDALARFVQDPATQHLRELTLALGGIDAGRVAAILGGLPTLVERLWIHDVRLEVGFAELLADCLATHPNVIGLALHTCTLGPAGVGWLGERGSFDRSSELTLHSVALDDEAAMRWATHRSPGRLRMLDLEEPSFDGDHAMRGPGLIALAEAGWFDELESLALSYHRLTGDTLAQVLDRADLSRLRYLRLHCTGFDANDAERMREAKAQLPALEQLELAYTDLEGDAANELAASFTSSRVRELLG